MAGQIEGNPEVILKKRKVNEQKRIEKKQQVAKRADERRKARLTKRKSNFVRAETLVAAHRASEREQERVNRVSEYDRESLKEAAKESGDDDDDSELVFVVRIKGPYNAKVPERARKVLEILRLQSVNTATFVKYNSKVKPLLRLVNPYIVMGKPSLATVRTLIQTRATVKQDDVSVPLNDNNLIEEKLGDFGLICTEDIIHEIATLGDSFKECVKFMEPFKLGQPVTGWSSLSKLRRLELREKAEEYKVSNSARAKLNEIDIDKFVADQI